MERVLSDQDLAPWSTFLCFNLLLLATIIPASVQISDNIVKQDSEPPKVINNELAPQPNPRKTPEKVPVSAPHPSDGKQKRGRYGVTDDSGSESSRGVQLDIEDDQVVIDNGLVQVTLSNPGGTVIAIQFNGIDNLLEMHNDEENRGYWDLDWSKPGHEHSGTYDRILGSNFSVIMEDSNQVELSFTRSWNASLGDDFIPLNIDRRFIVLRDCPGLYTYGIYDHIEGWPDFNLAETRIVFKLNKDKFHYMAISDERQRVMPMPEDRSSGLPLAYPEAVLLSNPIDPALRGEVDDKYQYSCENKDYAVHGWICNDPSVGFWMITPSNEFRNGGPLKQELTSHVGPTVLSMFVSLHYGGDDVLLKFRDGESWKKVFGPVFIYLNAVSEDEDPYTTLWEDAKEQTMTEIQSWPYEFPVSEDFPYNNQRGRVSGRLLVQDRFITGDCIAGYPAYVGLAPLGNAGSWQYEGKGYQFWTEVDANGYFFIDNIREGDYNLYAYVLGFIGDYRYDFNLTITAECDIALGDIVYEPPRDGPTLWEIGIPDRSAAEFYIPDPNPNYVNRLYLGHPNSDGTASTSVDRFRQYGLWERYAELYSDEDLVFATDWHNYQLDWFYAHVTRKGENNTFQATTWQVLFDLAVVDYNGMYKLRIALASAANANLHVRFNDPKIDPPHFATGLIGKDNAIARHGIHGLYWLFSINIPSDLLEEGTNTIYLTQSKHSSPFEGIMYDYIRLEGPSSL